MVLTLEEYIARHPVDEERVQAHQNTMLAQVRAYRLRELREQAGLPQAQVAERIGVGQRQVSKIENGDLENTRIGTIRGYLEAVGGRARRRLRHRRSTHPGRLILSPPPR